MAFPPMPSLPTNNILHHLTISSPSKYFNFFLFLLLVSKLSLMYFSIPHPPSPSRLSLPFQLLFLDVWGPVSVLSSNGFKFYLSIVDDFLSTFGFFLFMLIGCYYYFCSHSQICAQYFLYKYNFHSN